MDALTTFNNNFVYLHKQADVMKIVPVLHKARLRDVDEELQNLEYWLSRPVIERIAAVTQLRALSMKPGERMDKTVFIKRKMHA